VTPTAEEEEFLCFFFRVNEGTGIENGPG
jgi:hypothetical protein